MLDEKVRGGGEGGVHTYGTPMDQWMRQQNYCGLRGGGKGVLISRENKGKRVNNVAADNLVVGGLVVDALAEWVRRPKSSRLTGEKPFLYKQERHVLNGEVGKRV